MYYEMDGTAADIRYKILTATVTPRPIAWVTTKSPAGIVNAAPYSFFNVMGHEPPTLVLGLLRDPVKGFKDTAENILATGEFVVNLVSNDLAPAMNITCMDAPRDISELECAGLEAAPSRLVAPPRIKASPVSLECRSLSAVVTGPQQTIVIGRIVAAHIADEFVIDGVRGHIDTPALGLIGRMHGGGWYARTTDLFSIDRPTYAGWLQEQERAQERLQDKAKEQNTK
ncbi:MULTISPECIES: flavin reductase family protein [unclassified Beijerinckia]|uniref:flavin reductase family protein n=1 Tax=unclassified Beijerinckia TaxID=2638183 RepID=UPI000897DA7B|nr:MULTISPECIES: flavin reductase family protein [unclassified Beijerinckia]MDH7796249.1 flavin reductase (DIM6/NTAB) family NADH-FMN oxidoreductase RutF [Beijerinckia sp. GAS462]SEC36881.1 NADH-FMN oxidoreductase RutF, flavin reductase (DIM6/NTAB) family [Beijerinckia sp. 28-YEA-48]